MEFSDRQKTIIDIVKKSEPITGEQIAERLSLTRAAIRSDLAILTMSQALEAKPRVGYFYSGKNFSFLVGEQLKKITVNEIKSMPAVVQEKASVYDAIVRIFLEDVGTLFVVKEGGMLEGVVSRKDLLKAAMGNADLHSLPVGVIMTRMPNIISVFPEESVYQAASRIVEQEIDALPVVRRIADDNDTDDEAYQRVQYELIGKVTKTNITRLFVALVEGR